MFLGQAGEAASRSRSEPVEIEGQAPGCSVGPSKGEVRAVARKSTSKVRSVARKSTATPTHASVGISEARNVDASEESDNDGVEKTSLGEGTSFYGRPLSPVDVKRVTCPMQLGNLVRRVNVATAAQASDETP